MSENSPRLDHNGKPFSPAQILALERAELTRIRVMRDAMILAERREELVEMAVVQRQGRRSLRSAAALRLLLNYLMCLCLAESLPFLGDIPLGASKTSFERV